MSGQADWFQRVAHDLRDPLSPLQTAVYLLRSGDISGEERVRMLELIERQGQRLAYMIDELADCLRAQRGRLLVQRTEVDLAVVATLAVARAPAAPVHCDATGGPLRVLGDETRLVQLVRILRELRLSPEAAEPAALVVERHDGRARLQRTLACTDELRQAPERLFEAPLPAALGEGLGLQLPLAAAIARGHGGELHAEPRPDGRLAVIAELPLLA